VEVREKFHNLESLGSDREYEEAICHGIKRPKVSDMSFIEHAPDPRHHIVARRTAGLPKKEKAVTHGERIAEKQMSV
jgi:hypothetical protein